MTIPTNNTTPVINQDQTINTDLIISDIQKLIINLPGRPPAMLAKDLAGIYAVETGHLNRAVKRNRDRFPKDFMFQATDIEKENLISQFGMSQKAQTANPYLFTQMGANQLSSVLQSDTAIQRSIQIMRAFTAIEHVIDRADTENPGYTPWAVEANSVRFLLGMFNAPEHMVATEVAKHVSNIGGPDMRDNVGLLPCSQNIKEEEIYLEPTELGLKFGLSARQINGFLQNMGLQYKASKRWVVSGPGKSMCIKHAWSKGSKSGYNLKWRYSDIERLVKSEREKVYNILVD